MNQVRILQSALEQLLGPDEVRVPPGCFTRFASHSDLYRDKETREAVRKVLTEDMMYRLVRQWPLIECDVKNPSDFIEVAQKMGLNDPGKKQVRPVDRLIADFNLLPYLFEKYRGKIAVCGGAAVGALLDSSEKTHPWPLEEHRDVDIFFYGVSQAEATNILEDCVSILISKAEPKGYFQGDLNDIPGGTRIIESARIERSLKFVNVHFKLATKFGKVYRIYQFILRIYPTLDSILGAFDIPMSSFCYDGESFYCTPMAAFCARRRILVANLSRRSPSFEHRLVKYCNRFGLKLYFPGLNFETFYDEKRQNLPRLKDETLEKIAALVRGDGLRLFDYRDNVHSSKDIINSALEEFVFPDQRFLPILNRIYFFEDVVRISCFKHKFSVENGEEMHRYSDYSHTHIHDGQISIANTRMLMVGNLDGVIITQSFTNEDDLSQKGIKRIFRLMISCPEIDVLDEHEFADQFIETNEKFYRRFVKPYLVKYPGPARDATARIIHFYLGRRVENFSKVEKALTGLKWNDQNPDTQWTASFHPLNANPEAYYGDHYQKFEVGIPAPTATTLLLGYRHDNDSLFARLPKEIMRLIMLHVMKLYAF